MGCLLTRHAVAPHIDLRDILCHPAYDAPTLLCALHRVVQLSDKQLDTLCTATHGRVCALTDMHVYVYGRGIGEVPCLHWEPMHATRLLSILNQQQLYAVYNYLCTTTR